MLFVSSPGLYHVAAQRGCARAVIKAVQPVFRVIVPVVARPFRFTQPLADIFNRGIFERVKSLVNILTSSSL